MSEWELPLSVEIGDKEYNIRNRCDYRVILDVIEALSDEEEEQNFRAHCAMFIFFEHPEELPDPLTVITDEEVEIVQEAMSKIMFIANCGEEEKKEDEQKPKLMDWSFDFKNIAPPVSRVLGYSVRDERNYTHWYDFIGAYREIGECYWSQVMNIRQKKMKGKTLDATEKAFYRESKKDIDLPKKLSTAEQAWLDEDF